MEHAKVLSRKYGLGWKEPIPHQPHLRPGEHWPEECKEALSHTFHRVFTCPKCKAQYYYSRDHEDMKDAIGLTCLGTYTLPIREG